MTTAIRCLRAAGEPTRLRILKIMIEARVEICACEIIDAIQKPSYTVSKSLAVLASAGLVSERRAGRQMMYRLVGGPFNGKLLDAVAAISPADSPETLADQKRLAARLAKRVNGSCVAGCP